MWTYKGRRKRENEERDEGKWIEEEREKRENSTGAKREIGTHRIEKNKEGGEVRGIVDPRRKVKYVKTKYTLGIRAFIGG